MQQLMPALSIRQPWAWLIVNGFKDVENRSWPTPFRGRVLIHAGKTLTEAYYREVRSSLAAAGLLPPEFPAIEDLPRGGIVGEAVIYDCVDVCASPWFIEGNHAFLLRNAKPSAFWPMNGRLGFFDVRVADPRHG